MLLRIHPDNPNQRKIATVVDCLKKGGLVIYPTDTLYGLGCDIGNKAAMQKLYRYKGVKKEKADFSIICNDLSHISEFAAQLDNSTYKLMKQCLPGPYTFILRASRNLPNVFRNKKKTIGIRVPGNPIAHDIVTELGHPIVTTSVKIEDDYVDYPTDPAVIYDIFGRHVDIVIDGGPGGLIPSTVIDCTGSEPVLIRKGKGEVDML
jgi:tRNA threonylcarbamoyl adenosine modification protein (Sua5/YciO/YrdC/YwlC family)